MAPKKNSEVKIEVELKESKSSNVSPFSTANSKNKMLFIEDKRSPQCRCIRTVFLTLKVEYSSRYVGMDDKNEKQNPEFIRLNPRETIPILIDGDFCLAESVAIATYLCNKYEDKEKREDQKLYPTDPHIRARVDQVLQASVIVDAMINAYLNIQGVAYKGGHMNDANIKDVIKALRIASRFLEYTDNTYMASKSFTLADVFMATPLLFMEKVDNRIESGFFSKFPTVSMFLKRVRKNKNYFTVHEKATDKMAKAYGARLKHQKFIKTTLSSDED